MPFAATALFSVLAGLVIQVFYLLTLQKALNRCSPQNRTMTPGLVWLQIIPFFSYVWMFFNVLAIGRSLENEFRSRGTVRHRPGLALGLTTAIVCSSGEVFLIASNWRFVPWIGYFARNQITLGIRPLYYFGVLLLLAYLVMAIVYWVKVAGYSRDLSWRWDAVAGSSQSAPNWVEAQQDAQRSVGGGHPASQTYPPPTGYCWNCGAAVWGGGFCGKCGARVKHD